MNYKQIQTDCPKAYTELSKWIESNGYEWIFFTARDLYDYFDSVGIIIGIDYSIYEDELEPENSKITWNISIDTFKQFDEDVSVQESYYDVPRTEAETAAFTKAFSIREEQLKPIPPKENDHR